MPNKFEDLLEEALDAGVDPEWVERVRAASDGSPLRQEKKQLEQQLKEATENATRYRTAALSGVFSQLGVKVKPDALNIPPDLDPLDAEKVREWAEGMGLAEPAPPATPPEEQDAHQRLVDAAAGGATPQAQTARDEVLSATTKEEFLAKARAAGFVQQN